MADIVPHDVADEEQGEEDPQRGEEQVEVVMILDILEDEALDDVDDELEESGHKRHRHPDEKAQDEEEVALADVALSPADESVEQRCDGLTEGRHRRVQWLWAYDLDLARGPEHDDLRGLTRRLVALTVLDDIVYASDDLGTDTREEEWGRLPTDVGRGRDDGTAQALAEGGGEELTALADTEGAPFAEEVGRYARSMGIDDGDGAYGELHKVIGDLGDFAHQTLDFVGLCYEDEHTLAVFATLELVDTAHGFFVGGIATDTPHRICGIEDDPAAAQGLYSFVQVGFVVRLLSNLLCVHLHIYNR